MGGKDWARAEGETDREMYAGWIRDTMGPILLMVTTPMFMMIVYHTVSSFNGSLIECFAYVFANPDWLLPFSAKTLWVTPLDPEAWRMIGAFMVFELLLMRIVPGKEFRATMTSTGHVPVYTANGVQCLFISAITFIVLGYYGYIDPTRVYDKFGEILAALNLFALIFCTILTVKGRYFPSTADSGSTGNAIIDFYWGTELYPRILGWDVKQFTNCRFGMMFWAIGPIAYAWKQYAIKGYVSDSMLVSVTLQLIYVTKFFWWETGYFCSMDIQHDRAGYYICWGCLCWVPSIYTSQSLYLVEHPVELGRVLSLTIFLLGVLMIWINYDSDRQRQSFRRNTKAKIWGKTPVKIDAEYVTTCGTKRQSVLLASGWWGVSRHFHYVPEILAAFCWSVPALFENFLPFFYVVFLTILLVDRADRDDARCASKYTKYWREYCRLVPYKIVPGIY
eukprot:CAMPEP_0114534976 /NCGR_PEP_ID=MMETSP0109-20121206/28147_1 /TAXON_ID=29199 /ORGANISM="Chlorarachnion reptans, Strain CCCM449" /LENGTH=448 /DNA_ID=CAMNT_0001718465 /DNA_START=48 /DNA_END=1394 /DNA_ORIENTATION=-